MIKNCYIHLPFCKNICSYCDFCKNYYKEDIVLKYLESLEIEINSLYKNDILNTLYIGGGTPSALSFNCLDKLFEIIKKLKLNNNYEFTFECNYEDITEELLIKLKENKVNRISIGIQTFNEKFKSFLNRNINKDKMIETIILTKKYFDNINIDLMYSLKNQDLNDLKDDLNILVNLDISHISTYSLIIEEHTKLYIQNVNELKDEIQSEMYYYITNILKENGYKHYELSNFSKEGYESKHNLNYWNNNEYYGFGLGASGFINDKRYDNTRSLTNYLNKKRVMYEENTNYLDSIKDYVMLSLRKTDGINKKDFKKRYNIDIKDAFDINYLIKQKIIIEDKKNIYIPLNYLYVSNEVIIAFLDTYLLN